MQSNLVLSTEKPTSLEFEPKILDELAQFYGELFSLSPLTSKIYAYLIFDFEKRGVTFDDLVSVFSASKSSVSCSLSSLLDADLIQHVNHPESRKRYFVTNPDYIKVRLQDIANQMYEEIRILDNLNNFQKKHANFTNRFIKYKSLLTKNIVNIEETLKEF